MGAVKNHEFIDFLNAVDPKGFVYVKCDDCGEDEMKKELMYVHYVGRICRRCADRMYSIIGRGR